MHGVERGILQVMAEDDDLAYVVPEEGSIRWKDTMCIPSDGPNPEGTHAFVNYILEAEVHGQIASEIKYPCPNDAAMAFIPEDDRNDSSIYPSKETLERLDRSYLEASLGLGAGQFRTMASIALPLAKPGIILVFITALGTLLISDLIEPFTDSLVTAVVATVIARCSARWRRSHSGAFAFPGRALSEDAMRLQRPDAGIKLEPEPDAGPMT